MIQVHLQFLTDLKSSGSSFSSNLSTISLNFSDYFKIVKPYIKSLNSIGRQSKSWPNCKKRTQIEWDCPNVIFHCPFSTNSEISTFSEGLDQKYSKLQPRFKFSEPYIEFYQKSSFKYRVLKRSCWKPRQALRNFHENFKKGQFIGPNTAVTRAV